MAILKNLNSREDPIASQSIKWIACDRVYIKAVDTTPTPVFVKSDGSLPSGWTDLGIVNGHTKLVYQKEIKEVRTGVDQFLRLNYVGKKDASMEFQLSQVGTSVMSAISGITASVITAGSVTQYSLGAEDIVSKALLMVSQNKLDGREVQYYTPSADLSFEFGENGEETLIVGKANLSAFTYASDTRLFIMTVFE